MFYSGTVRSPRPQPFDFGHDEDSSHDVSKRSHDSALMGAVWKGGFIIEA